MDKQVQVMDKQFDLGRFEFVQSDRVQITGYRYGHNNMGNLDVWIDSSDKGKRFLSQITTDGDMGMINTGVYTKECYILRERATCKYYFLDINDCGIWLFNPSFLGSENFAITESAKIQQWVGATV